MAALRLGLTSFGGPVAHLGYFRHEYVERRRWLDDHAYSELIGLCQFLPGPASSQVGFAIGWLRAGPLGALAAWLGFTIPSALLMFAFALASGSLHGPLADAAIHGLKLAAVAIVAQAVIGMARTLTPDLPRGAIASVAAAAILFTGNPVAQLIVIAGGGLAGLLWCAPEPRTAQHSMGREPKRRTGVLALTAFAVLLVSLPVLASWNRWFGFAEVFYRSGALVFGGGHVVLPLLREGLVPQWLSDPAFLGGYGAAQAVPGPLFSIAGYLGALARPEAALAGSALATFAIFLPGLLLVTGALAFRQRVMGSESARRAMLGVNAAVVGILAAALYDPLWTAGVRSIMDAIIAASGLLLLLFVKPSPILIVGLCVLSSIGMAA